MRARPFTPQLSRLSLVSSTWPMAICTLRFRLPRHLSAATASSVRRWCTTAESGDRLVPGRPLMFLLLIRRMVLGADGDSLPPLTQEKLRMGQARNRAILNRPSADLLSNTLHFLGLLLMVFATLFLGSTP